MLNVLVMIALFGAAAGETEGEMEAFVENTFIPIDFTKSALEIKTNYATQGFWDWGFWFNDGTENLLGWSVNLMDQPSDPEWRIMLCNQVAAEITPASKVLGPRTWIFSLKDGRISALLDGKALITGVKPGEDGPGKCTDNYWETVAATPVKGIKVDEFAGSKVEGYRVVDISKAIPIEDTDSADQDAGNKETEDTDRTEMSGASQLGSGIVLVTTLLAFLGF